MRLDKYIAAAAGISRSDVKAALGRGRVCVNGAPARDPALKIDEQAARVTLDGRELCFSLHTHVMLNKPAGVLTATEDRAQPTVMDLLPEELRPRGLTPIGRLDKDTTGLLLLSTDGQLAHRLISPRWEQDKIYVARVEGRLTESDAARMAAGIALKDFTCAPAKLEILEAGEDESLCEVTVHEGKYHQVKRMLGALGHPVTALHRRSIAGIELDSALGAGQWRELTEAEKAHLYSVTDLEE